MIKIRKGLLYIYCISIVAGNILGKIIISLDFLKRPIRYLKDYNFHLIIDIFIVILLALMATSIIWAIVIIWIKCGIVEIVDKKDGKY